MAEEPPIVTTRVCRRAQLFAQPLFVPPDYSVVESFPGGRQIHTNLIIMLDNPPDFTVVIHEARLDEPTLRAFWNCIMTRPTKILYSDFTYAKFMLLNRSSYETARNEKGLSDINAVLATTHPERSGVAKNVTGRTFSSLFDDEAFGNGDRWAVLLYPHVYALYGGTVPPNPTGLQKAPAFRQFTSALAPVVRNNYNTDPTTNLVLLHNDEPRTTVICQTKLAAPAVQTISRLIREHLGPEIGEHLGPEIDVASWKYTLVSTPKYTMSRRETCYGRSMTMELLLRDFDEKTETPGDISAERTGVVGDIAAGDNFVKVFYAHYRGRFDCLMYVVYPPNMFK